MTHKNRLMAVSHRTLGIIKMLPRRFPNMSSPSTTSNPQDEDHTAILVSSLTCTLVALATVILRVLVRLKVVRNFGWDVCKPVSALPNIIIHHGCVLSAPVCVYY